MSHQYFWSVSWKRKTEYYMYAYAKSEHGQLLWPQSMTHID